MTRERDPAERYRRILADVSHEIRTPMNGILGIVELMLDAAPDRRQRRYLEMIRTSAGSLLQLLDDVLDYSRLEAGRVEPRTRDFNLRGRLANLLAVPAIQARRKGLALSCRVGREIGGAGLVFLSQMKSLTLRAGIATTINLQDFSFQTRDGAIQRFRFR